MKNLKGKLRKTFITATLFICSVIGGYAQNWQVYPYTPTGSVLTFPGVDGFHPTMDVDTEWWYLNMHLIGSAPQYKKYDVSLYYFYRPFYMRLFSITEPRSEERRVGKACRCRWSPYH